MSSLGRIERVLSLPPRPESAGAARHFLARQLKEHAEDNLVHTATLLLSEVVTNAVLHARTDVTVRCVLEGRGVLVEVLDGSTLPPRPRNHAAEAVTGRGLELLELLAEQHGVRLMDTGKSVWFALGGATPPRTEQVTTPLSDGGGADAPARVLLQGVPIGLYEVLQEHNEALLREYELHRLAVAPGDEAGHRRIADAARARVRISSAFAAVRASLPDDATQLDVELPLTRAEIAAFELLPGVLDEAEAVAARGQLLTRPALPELLALRHWMYGQVISQARGGVPERWSPTVARLDAPLTPPADVDTRWVRHTRRAVVVADDGNRILAVSAAAGELFGWRPEELVGQRVTVLVPARLREAHVTGFTRQLVTGRETILCREVAVPGLHRDGREVPVRLLLERLPLVGRTAYVAWFRPA